jgi:hypothetical protein
MRTLSLLALSLSLLVSACSDALTAPTPSLEATGPALSLSPRCVVPSMDTTRVSLPRLPRTPLDTVTGRFVGGRDPGLLPCPTLPRPRVVVALPTP